MCFFTEPYMGVSQDSAAAADFANFPLELTEEQVREFLMLQDGGASLDGPVKAAAPSNSNSNFFLQPSSFLHPVGAQSEHFPVALPRGAVYAPVVKGEAKQHQAQASPMETQHFVDMTGPSYLYGVGSKRGAEELEEEEEELEAPKTKRSRDSAHGRQKKPRFTWSPELCSIFDYAMSVLDEDLQTPKNIMQVMRNRNSDIPEGFRADHIKSHLQKWRLAKKKGRTLQCRGASRAPVPPMPVDVKQEEEDGERGEKMKRVGVQEPSFPGMSVQQPQQPGMGFSGQGGHHVEYYSQPLACGVSSGRFMQHEQDEVAAMKQDVTRDSPPQWPPVSPGFPEDLSEVPLPMYSPHFPISLSDSNLEDDFLGLGGFMDPMEAEIAGAFAGTLQSQGSPVSSGMTSESGASDPSSLLHSGMPLSMPMPMPTSVPKENPLHWLLMGYQMGFQNGCTQFGASSAHSQVPTSLFQTRFSSGLE